MNVLFAWIARLLGTSVAAVQTRQDPPATVDVATHVAGAIVSHSGPFSDLEVPRSQQPMPARLLGTWSEPFYLIDLTRPEPEQITRLRALWPNIDCDIVLRLLGESDWRPRLVAAYLVALKRLPDFDDVIGRLLLRSDVCYSGRGYCLALATSNTAIARNYLRRYLDHYLARPDLRFEQGEALAAIAYLDQINQTDVLAEYTAAWDMFVKDKPSWNAQRSIERFREEIQGLDALRVACSA